MADLESLRPEAILDGIHIVDVGADDDLIGAAWLRECDHAVDADVEIGEDGLAHSIEEEVPEAAEDAAQEACDGCPVTAIELD